MSLLEDVFLEDEAGEAQELERIIEGDDYDERHRSRSPDSNNASEKEDEAEEDKRRVDPSKAKPTRVVKNPRVILNPARLTGPRGIQVLPEHFKDFQFKGKGHEKEDIDLVLKKLEHWAYRLYPKFKFEDCLKKIETLGKKRPVMVHLHRIRTDQFTSEEIIAQKDSSDEEAPEPEPIDEFDILLQQQIELARATPAPSTVKKGFDTPVVERSLMMPKVTSSPSINEEQKERMLRNRRLAEERRLLRLKQNNINNESNTFDNNQNTHDNNQNTQDNNLDNYEIMAKKQNKSNIIDSSDEEDDNVVEQSVTVDIHDNSRELSKNNNIDKHMDIDNGEINIRVSQDLHNHGKEMSDNDKLSKDNETDNDLDKHRNDFVNDTPETIKNTSIMEKEIYDNTNHIFDVNNDFDNHNIDKDNQTDKIFKEYTDANNTKDNQHNANKQSLQDNMEKEEKDNYKSNKQLDNSDINIGNEVTDNVEENIMDVDFNEEF